jgi:hypothetical protein
MRSDPARHHYLDWVTHYLADARRQTLALRDFLDDGDGAM